MNHAFNPCFCLDIANADKNRTFESTKQSLMSG